MDIPNLYLPATVVHHQWLDCSPRNREVGSSSPTCVMAAVRPAMDKSKTLTKHLIFRCKMIVRVTLETEAPFCDRRWKVKETSLLRPWAQFHKLNLSLKSVLTPKFVITSPHSYFTNLSYFLIIIRLLEIFRHPDTCLKYYEGKYYSKSSKGGGLCFGQE